MWGLWPNPQGWDLMPIPGRQRQNWFGLEDIWLVSSAELLLAGGRIPHIQLGKWSVSSTNKKETLRLVESVFPSTSSELPEGYSGGSGRRIKSLIPIWAKLVRPCIKKQNTNKKSWRQGSGGKAFVESTQTTTWHSNPSMTLSQNLSSLFTVAASCNTTQHSHQHTPCNFPCP
jgi:hypothetical protein